MRTVLLLVTMLLTASRLPAQSAGTELRDKLDARVAEYTLSANGLADALARASAQFQIPMGIEWVKDKDTVRSFSRTWKEATVRKILNSIVEAYPGYAFQSEDGVVEVLRRDLLKERHNFLNLRVPDFFEVREEAVGLTNQRLRGVVENIVSPRNWPPGAGEGGSYATGIHEAPIAIKLRGSTVREALDKLAAASERNLWVVTFSDGAARTPAGYRRTETLWHPTPFPNADQPMWDFLAWSEYLTEFPRPQSH
jgi:hypothetical protein